MTLHLHNTQIAVKPHFAYHAMASGGSLADNCIMRIMLRQLREALGISQEEVADRLGCSISQVSRWESGKSNIPSERLPDLARAYEARVTDIFQDDDSKIVPLGPQIPIRGKVAAGVWAEAWDISDQGLTMMGRADSDAPLRDRFGVIVEGDSMSEKYPSGTFLDCVAFYANVEILTGRRVIVQRRNYSGEIEVTVKEYRLDDDGVEWLVPRSHNPAFQAFRVDAPGDDIEEVQIIGIVIGAYLPE